MLQVYSLSRNIQYLKSEIVFPVRTEVRKNGIGSFFLAWDVDTLMKYMLFTCVCIFSLIIIFPSSGTGYVPSKCSNMDCFLSGSF